MIDDIDLNEKVDILSMEDQKIKQVVELLSNDASRKILKLLFKNSLTASDIAKEADLSLPLVMYHLKKMQDANMVRPTNVGKTLESKDTKRYTTTKFAIVIVADSVKEKVKESKSIKRGFSGLYKFASIGIVTGAAWFASMFAQQRDNEATIVPIEEMSQPESGVATEMAQDAAMEATVEEFAESEFVPPEMAERALNMPVEETTQIFPADVLWSTVIALGVLAVGLIIERVIRAKRS
ncbi:MAG: winged helix-turn-helix domain-containing protein [Nitrosopumilaceae archaeon]|nr:winged helix-turn-helix domain-containing protein [Nitrosopumilaceae archaeon]